MIRFTPATRLSWGLVMLTACVLLIGDLVGLTPGRSEEMLDARRKFCETLGIP